MIIKKMIAKNKSQSVMALGLFFLFFCFGCKDTWREPVTRMKFVWVPGGCFQMGSPSDEEGRERDEGPVHEVCVDGFWMGKYEVSNAQFRKFRADHKVNRTATAQPLNDDDQPAVRVSWEDAKMFAKWLTEKNKGKHTFRLPTEAEWEYACQRGASAPVYKEDDICEYANVHDKTSKKLNLSHLKHYQCDDEYGATSPVGKFEPNAAGLYDMLGNASEWCEDEYDSNAYDKHQHKNPLFKNKRKIRTRGNPKSDNAKKPGPSVSSSRVIRGGSWKTGPKHVRCAGRDHFLYKLGKNHIGFRLVKVKG